MLEGKIVGRASQIPASPSDAPALSQMLERLRNMSQSAGGSLDALERFSYRLNGHSGPQQAGPAGTNPNVSQVPEGILPVLAAELETLHKFLSAIELQVSELNRLA